MEGVDAVTDFAPPATGRRRPVQGEGWEYHFRRAGRMFTLRECDQ